MGGVPQATQRFRALLLFFTVGFSVLSGPRVLNEGPHLLTPPPRRRFEVRQYRAYDAGVVHIPGVWSVTGAKAMLQSNI